MTSLRKIFFCIIALFCVAGLSAQSTETLNVMTYNIKGHGMTDSRLADIAKVINQQNPDIVALQEVDNRTFLGLKHNYLEELAEATGMNYEFFPLVGTYYGIGLLSKEKPLSVDTHRVERGANSTDKEDRGFIIAEFNDFFFMSTHYSLNADDRDVATDWAVDFALNSDKTVFIAGDFNAKPTYRAIVTFKNNGFKILNDINEYTYPAEAPESCIDMLLCYSNFREAVKYDVTDSYIAETEGLEQPILDNLRVHGAAYAHRKVGENLDLTEETPVYEGTFKPGNGWQHVKFDKEVPTRYFCMEALNAYDGKDYAAIAELELLGTDGKPLSRQHWKVVYADSEETEEANNIATNVFDLQESTFWHTNYSTAKQKFPHQIVINLGEDKVVTGFSYLPRAEAGKTGMIKDYRVYIKKNPFKL